LAAAIYAFEMPEVLPGICPLLSCRAPVPLW
jgi:hypothetical protein